MPALLVDAPVVQHQRLAETLWLLRLHAPEIARLSAPGHFVQVDCDPTCTVPRPISIFGVDGAAGTVDLFYRVVGHGTRALSQRVVGQSVTLLGPLGRPFTLDARVPTDYLLIAGGIGLAPLYFLAHRLADLAVPFLTVTLLLGLEEACPLPLFDDARPLPGVDAGLSCSLFPAGTALTSRLGSLTPRPGWFHGYVTALAEQYIAALPEEQRRRVRIATCGPTPMMQAVAGLAHRFDIPGEASLEERMACGFGGCAGCVAPISEAGATHWNYRRVCREGPVFPLSSVRWST
jgi:dihydroorotate dehydrogenase electron transfer subunit